MWQSDIVLDKYWVTQSGYLDLQLQWHLLWVLHMESSYSIMVFQMKIWIRKFQRESTTTGQFMTAPTIPLQMIW